MAHRPTPPPATPVRSRAGAVAVALAAAYAGVILPSLLDAEHHQDEEARRPARPEKASPGRTAALVAAPSASRPEEVTRRADPLQGATDVVRP